MTGGRTTTSTEVTLEPSEELKSSPMIETMVSLTRVVGFVVRVTVETKLGVPTAGLDDSSIENEKQHIPKLTFGIPTMVEPGDSMVVMLKLAEFPGR
jgi:hypothetical protein